MNNLSVENTKNGFKLMDFALILMLAAIVVIAVPLGIGTTIFILETAPHLLTPLADLLGGLPVIVLGLLGILVLSPFLRVLSDTVRLPQFASKTVRQTMAGLVKVTSRQNFVKQDYKSVSAIS